jgi:hypothetical protein
MVIRRSYVLTVSFSTLLLTVSTPPRMESGLVKTKEATEVGELFDIQRLREHICDILVCVDIDEL